MQNIKNFFYKFINYMKIQNKQIYQQNFQALHITETKNYIKNVETPISIYHLGENDRNYLYNLKKTIKFKDLMPKLPECLIEVWQGIFNVAITQSLNTKKVGFIEFSNKSLVDLWFIHRRISDINLMQSAPGPRNLKKEYHLPVKLFLK